MSSVSEKQCTSCGTMKPASDFNKCARNSSGLQSRCRECDKAAKRIYNKSAKARETQLRYTHSAHGKEARRAYRRSARGKANKREQQRRRKLGMKCVDAIKWAISTGRLTPQPCEVCGLPPVSIDGLRVVHAHHDDYSKPLEVRWLCALHHAELHRERRIENAA